MALGDTFVCLFFQPEWIEEWTQRLSYTLLATSPNR